MLHLDLADHYRSGSSRIHRLDPRVKIGGVLVFILIVSVLDPLRHGSWLSLALLFVATLLVSKAAGLGAGYAFKRSYLALPFVLGAAALPFTVRGTVLAEVGGWEISREGTIWLLGIFAKSWVSVQIAILLSVLTPFPDMLWALRSMRVPKPLLSIVAFMYRYLFVLLDEALRLRRARAARCAVGAQRAGGGLLWRGRVAGGLVGNLMLRSFERSERIYNAMLARSYTGELLTFGRPAVASEDVYLLAAWFSFLILALVIAFMF